VAGVRPNGALGDEGRTRSRGGSWWNEPRRAGRSRHPRPRVAPGAGRAVRRWRIDNAPRRRAGGFVNLSGGSVRAAAGGAGPRSIPASRL